MHATPRSLRDLSGFRISGLLGLFAGLICRSDAFDFMGSNNRGSNEITSVSSRASDDYRRTKRSDGTFQIETYSFG
jgi:hypothetical protein